MTELDRSGVVMWDMIWWCVCACRDNAGDCSGKCLEGVRWRFAGVGFCLGNCEGEDHGVFFPFSTSNVKGCGIVGTFVTCNVRLWLLGMRVVFRAAWMWRLFWVSGVDWWLSCEIDQLLGGFNCKLPLFLRVHIWSWASFCADCVYFMRNFTWKACDVCCNRTLWTAVISHILPLQAHSQHLLRHLVWNSPRHFVFEPK